jgi:hypothetical protein
MTNNALAYLRCPNGREAALELLWPEPAKKGTKGRNVTVNVTPGDSERPTPEDQSTQVA